MKKKNIRVYMALLTVAFALLLTGCVRLNIDINVKTNGKADVSILYALSNDMMESDEKILSEEEKKEWKEAGYNITDYSEDGFTGFCAVAKNIELSDLLEGDSGLGALTDDKYVLIDGKNCVLDLNVWSNEELNDNYQYLKMASSYGGYMNINLTTPKKALNHNATSVSEDGKTLTWNLLEIDKESVHAEFKVVKKNIFLPVLIILLIAGIAGMVYFQKKRKF